MRHPSYPEIGELAFGKCGRRVVSFALFGELFCALVLFIILMVRLESRSCAGGWVLVAWVSRVELYCVTATLICDGNEMISS